MTVFDKTGLYECLKPLTEGGMRVVSTGGTARLLKSKGLSVTLVEEQTGFPELLSGRVKTLHPLIHLPLLARKQTPADGRVLEKYHLQPFDLVICNLYPFGEKSSIQEDERLVEWIDVGGPTLLRSAAKNFSAVTVICSPEDYGLLKGPPPPLKARKKLAGKVFEHLSHYDSLVSARLLGDTKTSPQPEGRVASAPLAPPAEEKTKARRRTGAENPLSPPSGEKMETGGNLNREGGPPPPQPEVKADGGKTPAAPSLISQGELVQTLRYGENPGQKAEWFRDPSSPGGLHDLKRLQGGELSFNNLLDLESAASAVREFKEPCCVAVKHNNPCGAACGKDLREAVYGALNADPLSVFGGVLALNRILDEDTAKEMKGFFLEAVLAPDFSPAALRVLSKKPRLRALKWPEMLQFSPPDREVRQISGGVLQQDRDRTADKWSEDWKMTGKTPDLKTKKDLLFAWKICAHLKSNAIALVRDLRTLGLGMGQVNRVSAVQQAASRRRHFHPGGDGDVVLAGDGFFPFADSIEEAKRGGVGWIIQPGGSIKDREVIEKAEELNINMVLTGRRHFKH